MIETFADLCTVLYVVVDDLYQIVAVKRQLDLPVASMRTSGDDDETDVPTACSVLPSFLRPSPPVGSLAAHTAHSGQALHTRRRPRAASFPSSLVHVWSALSLTDEEASCVTLRFVRDP
jgi:hypothetical protein